MPTPSPGTSSPTTQISSTNYDLSSLDRILQGAMRNLGGLGFLLIKDNRVIYRKAFGDYKLEAVVPVASSTKWLSGALIMSLIDEGRLSLDDSVSKYIPTFTDQKTAITIRQLCAHTSGLPPEAPCRNNKKTTLEQCANEIARLSLRAEPGSEFFYGGVSMHVAGRLAEVASGKPWNELFKQKIAAPLGMNNTDYSAYGSTLNPRPAGDARSTLDDYGKFLQMILNRGEFNGSRILSEKSVAALHKDQTAGAAIKYTIFGNKAHLDAELPKARYGIGVWGERTNEAGDFLLASSPGALGSYPWVDFERRVAGIILTRSSFSRVLPVYLQVRAETERIIDRG